MIIDTGSCRAPTTWRVPRATVSFAGLIALMLVVIGGTAYATFGSPVAPMIVFSAISALCLRGLLHNYPHDVIGACNAVTLIRAALVALLSGALFTHPSSWLVFAIAVVAFASDGLDGWLARRAGLSSEFGARFDMELVCPLTPTALLPWIATSAAVVLLYSFAVDAWALLTRAT